jgi:hypothetical protein
MPVTKLVTPADFKKMAKRCRPFLLKVMVFSPESGYKFEVTIQLICTDNNDHVWKIIFNLYRKEDDEFIQIVGIEFQSGTPDEDRAIEDISVNGLNLEQTRVLRKELYPQAKSFEDGHQPSDDERAKIESTMRSALFAQ